MKVLDLFSGIGGFSLGLERAGMKTAAFCEIDEGCRRVLKKHWPAVPIFGNIRELNVNILNFYGIENIELLCGGFPCQDISSVKTDGRGLRGEWSGLWSEFFRLIYEIEPKYAVIENVSVLRSRGLCRILADLRSVGYDAEWHIIPAAAVGRIHPRERTWVVAYPASVGRRPLPFQRYLDIENTETGGDPRKTFSEWFKDSVFIKILKRFLRQIPECILLDNGVSTGVGRRIKQYGNAVVPKIPEIIGRAILRYEAEHDG